MTDELDLAVRAARRHITGDHYGEPASSPRDPHLLLTRRWLSTSLGCEKRLTVLLPPAGHAADMACPVLILLHGYGGNGRTWIAGTRLIEYLRGSNLIVVLPESGRRWFINDHAGFRYEDYLTHEVVPYIRGNFNVRTDRCGWGIGGFSMGGASALMQALRHPDLFSVVVSHAGAFDGPLRRGDPYLALRPNRDCLIPTAEVHERVWGPYGSATRKRYNPYAMIKARKAGLDLHVYADVGIADYGRIIRMNRHTATALRAAGIELEYHERQGAHDLDFLNNALPCSLDFVSRKLGLP